MKKIIVAKNIGFCFGVDRALKIAKNNAPIITIGNIIHNQYVIDELEKNYNIFVNLNPSIGSKVLIRAHGISLNEIIKLKTKQCSIIDATCPFVQKIHNIVRFESSLSRLIVILGTKKHPEIIGICGWIHNYNYIIISDLKTLHNNIINVVKIPITIVVQTTFDKKIWYNVIKVIKSICKDYKIFNTICSTTFKRQNEVIILSQSCDTIFVFGDRKSANSKKLYEIAVPLYKNTIYINNIIYNYKKNFEVINNSKKNIAIISGASTPKTIINNFVTLIKKQLIKNY